MVGGTLLLPGSFVAWLAGVGDDKCSHGPGIVVAWLAGVGEGKQKGGG